MIRDVPRNRLDRRFARNVGTLLVGQVLRVPITALYFVLATRALGVESFGRLTAVGALIMIAAPFSAMGSSALIVKYGATEPQTTRHWLGAALTLSLIGAVVVGALLLVLSPLLIPVGTDLAIVAGLVLAEFVCARSADLASAVFVAREEMHVTAFCQVLVPALRLVAAGVLVLSPTPVGLGSWVSALVVSSALSGLICLALAVRAVGRPVLGLTRFRGHWREAALFSVGIGVQTAHNDIDKVMLGKLDGPAGAGIYGAAYRVVDTAWLPVRAMLGAAWPRLFRHAREGRSELLPFVRAVAGPSVLYSVVVMAAMITGAGLLCPCSVSRQWCHSPRPGCGRPAAVPALPPRGRAHRHRTTGGPHHDPGDSARRQRPAQPVADPPLRGLGCRLVDPGVRSSAGFVAMGCLGTGGAPAGHRPRAGPGARVGMTRPDPTQPLRVTFLATVVTPPLGMENALLRLATALGNATRWRS